MTVPRTFPLPPGAEATAPPERRGVARDEVRLMAVRPGRLTTTRFRDLPDLLEPGDLVVVNTSATLPARVPARRADLRHPVTPHARCPGASLRERHWPRSC